MSNLTHFSLYFCCCAKQRLFHTLLIKFNHTNKNSKKDKK